MGVGVPSFFGGEVRGRRRQERWEVERERGESGDVISCSELGHNVLQSPKISFPFQRSFETTKREKEKRDGEGENKKGKGGG